MASNTGEYIVLKEGEGLRLQSGPGRDLIFKVTGEDTNGAFISASTFSVLAPLKLPSATPSGSPIPGRWPRMAARRCTSTMRRKRSSTC